MPNLTLTNGFVIKQPDIYLYNILASYILLIGLGGTLENLCVIVVFSRCNSLWSPSNIYILDLAISDMAISVVGFPFIAISGYKHEWIFAAEGCSVYSFLMSITGLHSILIMMTIALERYKAVNEPLKSVKIFSKKRSLFLVFATWTVAVVSSVPPLLGWNSYVLEGLQISCGFDMFNEKWRSKSYILCLLIFNFLLPVSIIIVCYVLIFVKVRQHAASMIAMHHNTSVTSEKDYRIQIKLIKMGFNVTVSFILAWGPYALVTILAISQLIVEQTSLIAVTSCGFFAKSFTIYNPIIYIFSYPRFKKELFRLCHINQRANNRHFETSRTIDSIRIHSKLERRNTIGSSIIGQTSLVRGRVQPAQRTVSVSSESYNRGASTDIYVLRITQL